MWLPVLPNDRFLEGDFTFGNVLLFFPEGLSSDWGKKKGCWSLSLQKKRDYHINRICVILIFCLVRRVCFTKQRSEKSCSGDFAS